MGVILDVRGEYMTLNLKQIELLEHGDSHILALLDGAQEPEAESESEEAPAGEAYDCKAGVSKWETGWSETKKAWCCRSERIGCPKETIVDIEVLPGTSAV